MAKTRVMATMPSTTTATSFLFKINISLPKSFEL
jgi:hypothetical protein